MPAQIIRLAVYLPEPGRADWAAAPGLHLATHAGSDISGNGARLGGKGIARNMLISSAGNALSAGNSQVVSESAGHVPIAAPLEQDM